MTAKSISQLVNEAEKLGLMKKGNRESLKWFAEKVRDLRSTQNTFLGSQPADRFRNAGNIGIGKMYCYNYDPKHKKKLPYYDTMPCVFIINIYPAKRAFLGLNLHYLPYTLRAKLLDELYKVETNSKLPMNKKLQITWEMIKSFASFPLAKACVKMYLIHHLRSRFIQIPATEWTAVAMLPIAGNFQKKSGMYVWTDSLKRARKNV